MDLSSLNELLIFAAKKETEKQLYPLWLIHRLISELGGTETIPFNEMLESVKQPDKVPNQKTGNEILEHFKPFVNADKENQQKRRL